MILIFFYFAAPAPTSLRLLPPRCACFPIAAPAQLAGHAPNHAATAPKLNLAAHALRLPRNFKICCFWLNLAAHAPTSLRTLRTLCACSHLAAPALSSLRLLPPGGDLVWNWRCVIYTHIVRLICSPKDFLETQSPSSIIFMITQYDVLCPVYRKACLLRQKILQRLQTIRHVWALYRVFGFILYGDPFWPIFPMHEFCWRFSDFFYTPRTNYVDVF